jgi:N,N'-diacetylchitobiose transport system substrate-binding protein
VKRRDLLISGAAAAGVAALGGAGLAGNPTAAQAAEADPVTLRVWLMQYSVPDPALAAVHAAFEQAHPGVTVQLEIQKWENIQDTLTAGLSSDDGPDIVETGNTQTVYFAAGNKLLDLTDKFDDLGGADWLPGMTDSGKWNAKQYAAPYFASNRIVVYRKDMFSAARVRVPRTRAEWLEACACLQRHFGRDPKFQAILLPGTYWYALSGLIWDHGGDLAVLNGSQWRGALDTPAAKAAMHEYQRLFAYSKLTPDSNEDVPRTSGVFAEGNSAMMVSLPVYYREAIAANPDLDGKLGVFAIPGLTRARSGYVFLGGSNLSISARSRNVAAAYEYVKTMTTDPVQTQLVQAPGSWIGPNSAKLAGAVAGDPPTSTALAAAVNGKVPPVDPRWAAVEAEPNVLRGYMRDVLSGGDLSRLARQASREITRRMSGTV